MVSFWPFKGDDSSAASFEKVLSQLSTKINRVSAQNDGFRQKQRRYKVLWTLYTTFAYILVAAILTLVTGYQRWGAVEYTAMVGSPVVIFAIRTALDAYYNYRLSNSQNHLNELYKQREQAIQKLKAATKYDSTQQLLDKYGGTPKKRAPSPQPQKKRKPDGPQGQQNVPPVPRTGFAPPPTANIQRPATSAGPQPPGPPNQAQRAVSGPNMMLPPPEPQEDFAPNAFSAPSPTHPPPPMLRQASAQYSEGPKWYDRILDVVLGEDETQAKNRMALICQNCRLVNGQAPPGARTPEDVGRWRCSSCQSWNGIESEHKQILSQISASATPRPPSGGEGAVPQAVQAEDESAEYEHVGGVDDDDDEIEVGAANAATEASPAASTRSKVRQRKKA